MPCPLASSLVVRSFLAVAGIVGALATPACVPPDDVAPTRRALGSAALLPDLVEELPQHLAIENDHQREWLRFSSTHWNAGLGKLQIRGGGQIAPCVLDGVAYDQCTYATQELLDATGGVVQTQPAGTAFFHPQHNHWHQAAVADFQIRRGAIDGPIVAAGNKTTYCFIDLDKSAMIGSNNTRTYFECNGDFQGLTPGWGDEYHHSTPLQELEVTGLAAGVYYLTHEVDPLDHWLESDETNNFTWVKFRLGRKGANPEVTVLGSAPCQPLDHLGGGYSAICETGGNK